MRFGMSILMGQTFRMNLTTRSCTMEMAMVASHLIWMLRTRSIRKRAKEVGQTFDDFEEGIQWQAKGIDIETDFLKLFVKKGLPQGSPNPEVDERETLVVQTT